MPPPPPERRRTMSPPQRRTADPARRKVDNPIKEEQHKKSGTAFSAFLVIAIALGFLAYIFNVGDFATSADKLFAGLDTSAKSQNDTVVNLTMRAIPIAGILICLLLLWGLARRISKAAKAIDKSRKLAKREPITLDEFQRITAVRGIRPRIAQQAYKLLAPFYRKSMRVRLDDRLVEDLKMTRTQVVDMRLNLLRNTDRKENPSTASDDVITVMDLLNYAQAANKVSLMDSVVRQSVRPAVPEKVPAQTTPAPR